MKHSHAQAHQTTRRILLLGCVTVPKLGVLTSLKLLAVSERRCLVL
jgi:hypothetical protein